MKKIILGLLVVGFLLGAPVVHAETQYFQQNQQIKIQIIQLLTQLIAQLQQELAIAIQQENLAKNQQPIPQNITPTQPNSLITVPPALINNTTNTPNADVKPVYNFDVFETVYENVIGNKNVIKMVNEDITAKKGLHLIVLRVVNDAVVTTNDPDMPSKFNVIPGSFYIGDHHQSGIIQDSQTTSETACSEVVDIQENDGCKPISTGTFNFTFTNPDNGSTRTIKITITNN